MQRASYCVAARITTVLLASIAKEQDNSRDPEKSNGHLINVALTTLSSKILFQHMA